MEAEPSDLVEHHVVARPVREATRSNSQCGIPSRQTQYKKINAPFDGAALEERGPTDPRTRTQGTQGLKPGMHPRNRGTQDPRTRRRTLRDRDPGTVKPQAPKNREPTTQGLGPKELRTQGPKAGDPWPRGAEARDHPRTPARDAPKQPWNPRPQDPAPDAQKQRPWDRKKPSTQEPGATDPRPGTQGPQSGGGDGVRDAD